MMLVKFDSPQVCSTCTYKLLYVTSYLPYLSLIEESFNSACMFLECYLRCQSTIVQAEDHIVGGLQMYYSRDSISLV